MANKQKPQQKKKNEKYWDMRRIVVAVLAVLMAVLLLLPMVTMMLPAGSAVTESEIDSLKGQQEEIKNKLADLKAQMAEIKDDQAQAIQKKNILVQELSAIDEELANMDRQLSLYDQQIAQTEQERLDAVKREQAQYELFCTRVRSMEEDGNVSYWSILFNASDFSDLLDRAMIVGDVMDYDNAVMDQLTATREEIERLKASLEESRAAQQLVRDDPAVKRQDQAAKVAEAKQLLDQINNDAAKVNQMLDEEYKEEARIGQEIVKKQKELEAQRRANNVTIDPGSGYRWPLDGGYTALSSVFGGRIHPVTGKYSTHTGIDIPAPSGTPIHAARGGQVVTSTNTGGTYGRYVVIDHGNGDSTLYAHMSSRNCSEGDIVKQGDVIGYVGTTGRSTGNHLHLEVRVNYSRVDPQKMYPNIKFTYR